jgi:SAM-dependent methyltransferase
MQSLSSTSVYNKTFFDELQLTDFRSAQEIVPLILDLIDAKSVIDVGCGSGAFLSVFQQHGVKDIQGIDNASLDSAMLHIPTDKILRHDLTRPFSVDKKFDLVTCMEVAEHLPASCAEQIVDNLTRLGPVILFSAAIPHQGGTNHINEQWPEYWAKLFASKGYVVIDCLREKIWQNDNVTYWYAQNLLWYIKADQLNEYPKLAAYAHSTSPNQLTWIHPKTYVKNYDRLNSPVVLMLRFAWGLIPRWLRLRLVKPLDSMIWRHVSTNYGR